MNAAALPQSVNSLPVMQLAEELVTSLSTGNVLLKAAPGAGKSTGLPLALLLDERVCGQIILLEPRRLAARAVAQRLAMHLNEKVGERVGLRMRGDTRISNETQLTVVTEGVLTRLIQSDPELEGVAVVIFDEFHERSLHADLGLALCLEIQQVLNERLSLLLMSATLDMQDLSATLDNCKVLSCEVLQHAVDIRYLGENNASLLVQIVSTVELALQENDGDILVFLPGVFEINRVRQAINSLALDSDVVIHSLHGGVKREEQQRITSKAQAGVRRVILSTSLSETSITIDGVRVVIDSGLERRSRIDTSSGAALLETVNASQASATQRAGRAGRTMPGVCYRLWSEYDHHRRALFWTPEILQADLAPLLLELAIWGVQDYNNLSWISVPTQASVLRAQDVLARLGFWEKNQLTSRGKLAASLPVHPRLASLLLWSAEHGCIETACKLVVLLEQRGLADNSIDIELTMHGALSVALQRLVDKLIIAVRTVTKGVLPNANMAEESCVSLGVMLAQAFPDWIAKKRSHNDGSYALACGAGACIDSSAMLAQQSWLAVAELGGTGKLGRIFKAATLNIDELQKSSPHLFDIQRYVEWDDKQARLIAESRVQIGKLIVSSKALQSINDDERISALIEGIGRVGISCLPFSDACLQWQARVTRMHSLSDDQWPQVDNESLLANIDQWLSPYLQGCSSLKSLQRLDLYQIFSSMLDYQQQVLLDEYLPISYRVPSGSKIKLSYVDPGNPLLPVRLQEMFGCTSNPAVARGKLPLKVHLLSPAGRVVQVTEDLANFWNTSYIDVKKDMAGRYPKHHWPDDPLTAKATARAKSRKNRS